MTGLAIGAGLPVCFGEPGAVADRSRSRAVAAVAPREPYVASAPPAVPFSERDCGDVGDAACLPSLYVAALMGAACLLRRRMKAIAWRVSSAMRLPLSWQSTREWFAWRPLSSSLPPSGPRSFQLTSRCVSVLFSRTNSPKMRPHSGPTLLLRRSKCVIVWFDFSTSHRACMPRSWLPMWFHFMHRLLTASADFSACARTTRPSARMLFPRRSMVLSITFSRMYLAMALQPSSPMEAYAKERELESLEESKCASSEGGAMSRAQARSGPLSWRAGGLSAGKPSA
mmetsp:Transcript_93810/g.242380  ORF Transcript_93810/g.242380 Transcript_93810/m.242380 type:complete len:284 (+) Transcript_93810:538-1389(+)